MAFNLKSSIALANSNNSSMASKTYLLKLTPLKNKQAVKLQLLIIKNIKNLVIYFKDFY